MPASAPDDSLVKLIVAAVVLGIIMLGKLLSALSKKAAGSDQARKPEPEAPEAMSPEEALEQMFRQMQSQRKAAGQPQAPAPQSLDEYFGRMERKGPAPAREVARVAPSLPRRTATVRKPAPPRVVLRRPKAAFAKPEGPTVKGEQSVLMQQSKARMQAAAAVAGPGATKAVQGWEAAKPMVALSGVKFSNSEAAKAIAYLEVFGPPRATRPYSGPPAAG